MRTWVFSVALAAVTACVATTSPPPPQEPPPPQGPPPSGPVEAGPPVAYPPDNGVLARHPNLAEANDLVRQSFTKIEEAQRANNNRLGGHAERAKQLLAQAADEIYQAAQVADQH